MLQNTQFYLHYLVETQKSVSLHRVFHSIRFKVNKGWSTAVLLFLCPYVKHRIRAAYLLADSSCNFLAS